MDAFIGEIRAVPWSWAPQDWAWCNGQSLPIASNPGLYAVIGKTFGGDSTTFKLPNLQGLVVSQAGIGKNLGQDLTPRPFAKTYGTPSVTLTANQSAAHNHVLHAALSTTASDYVTDPSKTTYMGRSSVAGAKSYNGTPTSLQPMSTKAITPTGGNAPHENQQPYLVMNYIICTIGWFPVRPS